MDVLVMGMWQRTDGESLWIGRWYPTTETITLDYRIPQTVPANKRGRLSFSTTFHLWGPPHHIQWGELDPRVDPTLITTLAEILTSANPDPICPRCLNSVVPWTAWKSVPPWKR